MGNLQNGHATGRTPQRILRRCQFGHRQHQSTRRNHRCRTAHSGYITHHKTIGGLKRRRLKRLDNDLWANASRITHCDGQRPSANKGRSAHVSSSRVVNVNKFMG
jgi:hypothetical protein